MKTRDLNKIPIVTVAGDRIDPQMKEAQMEVVKRLLLPHGFEHITVDDDRHAEALNDVLRCGQLIDPFKPVVILDVDCIPATPGIVLEAVMEAEGEEQTLCGAVQAANHIDPDEPYVGPFYWVGCLSNAQQIDFRATPHADVGQRMSRWWDGPKACLFPTHCREPRWKVIGRDFGLGTWYGGWQRDREIYHEFCSRDRVGVKHFLAVCEDVLNAA